MSNRLFTSCRRMTSMLVALAVASTLLLTGASAVLANGAACPIVRNNGTFSKDMLMGTYIQDHPGSYYLVDRMGVYDLFVYAPEDIGGGNYVWLWSDEMNDSPDYVCSTYYP